MTPAVCFDEDQLGRTCQGVEAAAKQMTFKVNIGAVKRLAGLAR